ncbi:hypothetical protein B296_00053229, partial [Ensete ventricosum]
MIADAGTSACSPTIGQLEKATQLTRRERCVTAACRPLLYREEIEKQRAHERYMRLREQGKTEQSRKDLGNIRQ